MSDLAARVRGWRWIVGFVALVLLNTLFTFENAWPTLWPRWSPRISFELGMALLVLGCCTAWGGAARPRLLTWLAVWTVVWTLARYIDVTVMALFGRPVNFYWDGRHVADVLEMSGIHSWQIVAAVSGVVALLWAVFAAARAAWGAIANLLDSNPVRRTSIALGLLMLASFAAQGVGGHDTRRVFSLPVAPVLARQAQMAIAQLGFDGGHLRLAASPRFDSGLAALHGADVLVLFAESYGVTTLDNPAQAAALAPRRRLLAQAIAGSGREVLSARVRSPTFGGGSWLAHASLLAGVDTRDPLDYELLLASHRPTLVSHFASHGWRTVNWMPGLQRPWPEGGFYGFDRYADANAIGYLGPAVGYWRTPDQASMALLAEQELAPDMARRAIPGPRFVVFPTLASHAPFGPLMAYTADWNRLLTRDAYSATQVARSLDEAAPAKGGLTAAYLQSIDRTFEWLGAYLADRAPAGLLTIVIGDHQPLARVSGQGAVWDVPVHVISGDAALMRRFAANGFALGLEPSQPPIGSMGDLTTLLLRVMDGG